MFYAVPGVAGGDRIRGKGFTGNTPNMQDAKRSEGVLEDNGGDNLEL